MGIAEDRGEKTVPRLAGWAWSVPLSPLMFRRDWVAWKAQARVPVPRLVTQPLLAVQEVAASGRTATIRKLRSPGRSALTKTVRAGRHAKAGRMPALPTVARRGGWHRGRGRGRRASSPGGGDIRRHSRRIDHDPGQPLDAGKPRMPPLPGLADFLCDSDPTAGAVGYRMPSATRACSTSHPWGNAFG